MLDPVIHQQHRLRLLALLYRNRSMSFTELRDACELTTGNAGGHLDTLEAAGYVKGARLLKALTFELHYKITDHGEEQFKGYLAALRDIIDVDRAPSMEEEATTSTSSDRSPTTE